MHKINSLDQLQEGMEGWQTHGDAPGGWLERSPMRNSEGGMLSWEAPPLTKLLLLHYPVLPWQEKVVKGWLMVVNILHRGADCLEPSVQDPVGYKNVFGESRDKAASCRQRVGSQHCVEPSLHSLESSLVTSFHNFCSGDNAPHKGSL